MLELAEDLTYRSPFLTELGVSHAFTTRAVGVEQLLSPGSALVELRQVHGAKVHEVGAELPPGALTGDGLVTGHAGRRLLVRTADCVPVLLARLDGRRVAAVHAGWRGLVAGVIPRALEVLGAGEYAAAVGPCLSTAHFEVGPEVVEAFARAGLGGVVDRSRPRAHVDLRSAAAIQLERAGLRRIDGTDRCTYEHADEFFSHRRDVTHGGAPRTGRLAALIAAR
jgi:YfiH family protein